MTAPDEPTGGLPRNYLRPCLLLLLGESASHGYDLLEQVQRLGIARPDPGGLYRALRALEREGLVQSWWEHSEVGPARRTYTLTADGADWLHAWAGTLRGVHTSLTAFLDRYQALARDGADTR